MRYSLAIEAPAVEPITLAEAKTHLGVHASQTGHDALIDGLIQSARQWCENYTRRVFVPRALTMRMDAFPETIYLPRPPFIALDALEYLDADGATQSVAASLYQVDPYGLDAPARLGLVLGAVWPIPQLGAVNAVTVTWRAGYGATVSPDADDLASGIPAAVKAAIKLLVGHWYDPPGLVRGAEADPLPRAVSALLGPFEVRDFGLE